MFWNYRALHWIKILDHNPISLINECIEKVCGVRVFLKIDLVEG